MVEKGLKVGFDGFVFPTAGLLAGPFPFRL